MQVKKTALDGVLVIEPKVFGDPRGFFFESFNQRHWLEKTGLVRDFVQDNHSRSVQGVLRGLHYQIRQPQGKLVRAVVGEIFDVAVDVRRHSPGFGRWVGEYLSADNKKQLWIPEGFAHGFLVLSESAEVLYRASEYYAPEHERCIAWNDPDLAINWPINTPPRLSEKDAGGLLFRNAEVYP
ncbi:MAG: dTDP-4-dehydrorhamnose 3,5-epimerase [Desulforhopalus sp.]|jgi:dTDP-4-dehydrorhamnose 3,5-epimerase|nr:dTDP-4-dehydrorhamnose 3,5-epimerase [Desulforhopalus sp.]